MKLFAQLILNGIIIGSMYSLASLGYALPFSVKLNNFAHGSLIMIGSYLGYIMLKYLSLPLWIVLPMTALAGLILGYIIFYLAINPFLNLSSWTVIVASTLAIAVILENIVLISHGFESFTLRSFINNPKIIEIHGLVITEIQIYLVVLSLLILFILFQVLRKSNIGIQFRAVANDPIAVEAMGISKNKIIMLSLMIGCALATGTGFIIALDYDQHASIGSGFLMKAYTATVIGGTEKLEKVVFAAYFIGIIENLVAGYISTEYKLASVFIILIIFLLFRKSGLEQIGLKREV